MGRLVYGYWDCPCCKSTGIRGDNRECPNCGKVRNSDVIFYMKPNVEYVPTDLSESVSKNPDWLCSFCDTLNPDDSPNCKSCGASKLESEKNYFDLHRSQSTCEPLESKEELSSDASFDEVDRHTRVEKTFSRRFNIKSLLSYGMGAAILAAIIVLLVYILGTSAKEMTVVDFSWSRSIEIQKLVTVDESGWSLPSGARLQYTNREFKEYETVLDHYETKTRPVSKQRIVGYEEYVTGYRDLGNGMFEEITATRPKYETYYDTETYQKPIYRQEPVYATKYYYEMDKWVFSRSVDTSGADKQPLWGQLDLSSNERAGTKSEKYIVNLRDTDGKIYAYIAPFSLWNKLSPNETVQATLTRWDAVCDVKIITSS